ALSGTLAQGCYIRGMALGDASFVTNMDFLRLPMTVFADWAVFRALPTFWVWPGAALIVGAALYISVREARLGGKKPVKAPASP
ncbi:MAG: EamA/RhaT family transporter, partial [Pseudomonadota bacterium]